MNNQIPPFPTLQPDVLTVKELTYQFSFDKENSSPSLSAELKNGLIYSFNASEWTPESYNLKINFSLTLAGVSRLFTGSTAIAGENARIGVAIRWQMVGMYCRQYAILKDCVLTKDQDEVSGNAECVFPARSLRKYLNWEIVLYLKEEDKSSQSQCFAHLPGSLLGVIDFKSLYLGGNLGEFNTVWENNGSAAPLWRLDLNFDSLSPEDPFDSDSIVLYLNRDHCASSLVYVDGEKISPMLYEIFANVCFILLKSAAEMEIELDDNVTQVVSVQDYLNVMISRLFKNWGKGDLERSNHTLMEEIRKSLQQAGLKVSGAQAKEEN